MAAATFRAGALDVRRRHGSTPVSGRSRAPARAGPRRSMRDGRPARRVLRHQGAQPFWLASAPPTDKAYNVERAFRAGWGGVVWKTLGEDPPVVNVNGPRYGAIHAQDRRVIGFNNIELITDRPLDVNLREIKEVKKNWPDRALLVSLMVPCTEESWKAILARVEETEADGVELNFGCPHGMSERGMGSAVGSADLSRWWRGGARPTPACRWWSSSPPTSATSASRPRPPIAVVRTPSRSSTPSTRSWASISTP